MIFKSSSSNRGSQIISVCSPLASQRASLALPQTHTYTQVPQFIMTPHITAFSRHASPVSSHDGGTTGTRNHLQQKFREPPPHMQIQNGEYPQRLQLWLAVLKGFGSIHYQDLVQSVQVKIGYLLISLRELSALYHGPQLGCDLYAFPAIHPTSTSAPCLIILTDLGYYLHQRRQNRVFGQPWLTLAQVVTYWSLITISFRLTVKFLGLHMAVSRPVLENITRQFTGS